MKNIILSCFVLVFLSSCSHRLVDTWRVTHYEVAQTNNQKATLTNIGTITFSDKNRGTKFLEFSFFGNQYRDQSQLIWEDSDNFVVIKSDNSDLARTWTKKKNKKKVQKWESIDADTQEKRTIILRK